MAAPLFHFWFLSFFALPKLKLLFGWLLLPALLEAQLACHVPNLGPEVKD